MSHQLGERMMMMMRDLGEVEGDDRTGSEWVEFKVDVAEWLWYFLRGEWHEAQCKDQWVWEELEESRVMVVFR